MSTAGPDGEGAVSSLAFLPPAAGAKKHTLIIGSLEGTLTVWTVGHAAPATTQDSMGGAVWSVASAQPAREARGAGDDADAAERDALVAVACDDGAVRVFEADLAAGELRYWRAMPRVEGRALSVAWYPGAEVVVAGTSGGTVHSYHAASQRELLRMTAGAATRGGPASVWALAVLADGTVVAGDSSGAVRWFDGAMGVQTATWTVHSADVLCLAASRDGRAVLASGVDHQVALFRRAGDGADGWVYVTSKRPHSGDVRGMALVPSREGPDTDLVASCSNDAHVILYSVAHFEKQHPSKLTPLPDPPSVSAARTEAGDALVVRQRGHVDVWALPECQSPASGTPEGHLLSSEAPPALLKRVRPQVQGSRVTAAAVSPDGQWVAVSDASSTRVFLASEGGDVGVDDRPVPPASALCFAGEGRLAVAGTAGGLWVFDMAGAEDEGGDAAPECRQLASAKGTEGDALTHLEADGRWLLACAKRKVLLFDLQKMGLHCSVPAPAGPLSCATLSAAHGLVLLASATNDVLLFDVAAAKRVECPALAGGVVEERLSSMPGSIHCVSLHPGVRGLCVLSTPTAFCIVNLLGPPPGAPQKKRKRTADYRPSDLLGGPRENGRVLMLEHPCLCLRFLPSGRLALVEKPWADVSATLPAPLHRRTFGN